MSYSYWRVGGVLISLSYALSLQYVLRSLNSVTHGQCNARPAVTFPVTGHYCPLTGTKLYCLMAVLTGAQGCKQLAHSPSPDRESNPRRLGRTSDIQPTNPLRRHVTPQCLLVQRTQ